jgi:hypothetical protein
MATINPVVGTEWTLIAERDQHFALSARSALPIIVDLAVTDEGTPPPYDLLGYELTNDPGDVITRPEVGAGYVWARAPYPITPVRLATWFGDAISVGCEDWVLASGYWNDDNLWIDTCSWSGP